MAGCSIFENVSQNVSSFVVQRFPSDSYEVKSGDTLWSIALKLSVDPAALMASNQISKPYVIYPGQVLSLVVTDKTKLIKLQLLDAPALSWYPPLAITPSIQKNSPFWLVYKKQFGKPIHTIAEGKVVVAGPDIPGYGNLVMISHPGGHLSLYAHCNDILVKEGDVVNRGEVIATVGKSEASSSMLRFQLRKQGTPIKASKVKFKI